MMPNKNLKEMVRSHDVDTHFFDMVAWDLQGNTLAAYLFIIYLDYIPWTSIDEMKENGLILKNKDKN